MGARDKSIKHKVSFLAKWLSSIKTWPSCRSKLHDESRLIQGVLMITKMMKKSSKV